MYDIFTYTWLILYTWILIKNVWNLSCDDKTDQQDENLHLLRSWMEQKHDPANLSVVQAGNGWRKLMNQVN